MSEQESVGVEFEGATIDEAIETGLARLGLSRAAARVEILADAKKGVLGFGGERARVRMSAREAIDPALESAAEESATDPTTDGDPGSEQGAPAVDDDSGGDEAELVVRDLVAKMGVEATVAARPGDDGPIVEISSPVGALLIGRHGQTLDAIEYLANRIVERRDPDHPRVAVDTEGYRERRATSLVEMAARMAEKARRTRRPVALPPMNPRDRRTVHMALRDLSVKTESRGRGPERRVVIVPA